LGQASFDFAPAQPQTGDTVTFTSTSGPGTVTWDLDADSVCDDASGSPITQVFPSAGSYRIKICLSDGSDASRIVPVSNRTPFASYSFVPATPVVRELVTFTSTAVDPDGPIVAYEWDLDGDGVFDDGNQATAQSFWRRPGTYAVGLRVTDRDGASAVAAAPVVVAPRPAGVFSPAPLVRVVGQATSTGAHLNLLSVTSPKGAHVGVRCDGGNCPYKHKRFTSKGKRVVLHRLARTYAAGTVIEVRVTKSETIGKFTRLRIRAGQNPARLDRCLRPGHPNKPITCPK
jgi:hypothetical protein